MHLQRVELAEIFTERSLLNGPLRALGKSYVNSFSIQRRDIGVSNEGYVSTLRMRERFIVCRTSNKVVPRV